MAELFYSFQGEGPSLGRRALFVRLMGCNLTCGYPHAPATADAPATGPMVCDTEYTWNRAKHDLDHGVRRLTPQQIWDELMLLDPSTTDPTVSEVGLIVVSGGEPLLRKRALANLAERAAATGRCLEIETNGTIHPGRELLETGATFNAGLKLASSAVPRQKRIKSAAIRVLQAGGRTRWKFVVCGSQEQGEQDLAEIARLQDEFGLTDIWLSPEGTAAATVVDGMRMLASAALAHGWNLTTREQVLLWGDERGR